MGGHPGPNDDPRSGPWSAVRMAEVLSGFVIGYGLSLLFTALGALMLLEARGRSPYLARAIAPSLSFAMLSVPISIVAFIAWTAMGMVMGALYKGARANLSGAGMGSPNWIYTAGVVLLGGCILGLICYMWQRLPPWRITMFAIVTVGLFGWAMPYLAEQARL